LYLQHKSDYLSSAGDFHCFVVIVHHVYMPKAILLKVKLAEEEDPLNCLYCFEEPEIVLDAVFSLLLDHLLLPSLMIELQKHLKLSLPQIQLGLKELLQLSSQL